MILSALLPFAAPFGLPVAQEAGLVRAFVSVARTGVDPNIVLPPYGEDGEQPYVSGMNSPQSLKSGTRWYQYNQADVAVDFRHGRIGAYGDEVALWKQNQGVDTTKGRVTNEQAVALARRFFAAAGWGESVVWPATYRVAVKGVYDAEDRGTLEIHLRSAASGVPYTGEGEAIIEINRWTGQLNSFNGPFNTRPAPPLSTLPRGTLAQARSVALSYGVELRGESLTDLPSHPFALRVWCPRLEDDGTLRDPASYPLSVRAAAAAGRGVLAYEGWIAGGSHESMLYVVVDAATGAILHTEGPPGLGSGGGGGSGGRPIPAAALTVPTAPRPWRVSTGKKGWAAWTTPAPSALTPLALSPPKKGTRLSLTDGKAAFPALYDPRANLLAVSGKTYRPGPALAALLRRRS